MALEPRTKWRHSSAFSLAAPEGISDPSPSTETKLSPLPSRQTTFKVRRFTRACQGERSFRACRPSVGELTVRQVFFLPFDENFAQERRQDP